MRQIDSSVVRRLNAADGYLELGMPGHALSELALIRDAGPLCPAVEFMTGLALKNQSRFDEAIEQLHRAATDIPAPHNSDAWRMLGECYRETGLGELAEIAEMFAEESGVPGDWDTEPASVEQGDAADEACPASPFHLEWGNGPANDRLSCDFHLPKK